MAQQQRAERTPSSLTLRLISAVVMLPVVCGAVWLGSWFFAALLALVAGLMYWEWQGLCGSGRFEEAGYAAACAAGPFLYLAVGIEVALFAGVACATVNFARGSEHRVFLATGFIYIYLALVALIWLRDLDHYGQTVFWLGAAVVMTDTCAYFTGRTLGGPKLAPKISPKKTWSGLLGGIVGAALAGAVVASVVEADIVGVTLVSGTFAVVAQIGDLAVSKAKRTFGVKDSGSIIPGHGGVLDRFDGILSTSLALAAVSVAGNGSPLQWL